MIIRKKCWPEWFDKILSGEKNYDLRLADFEVKSGDTLILEEWDPKLKKYTGRNIAKEVTYVGKTKNQKWWSQEDVDKYGFAIMSLK